MGPEPPRLVVRRGSHMILTEPFPFPCVPTVPCGRHGSQTASPSIMRAVITPHLPPKPAARAGTAQKPSSYAHVASTPLPHYPPAHPFTLASGTTSQPSSPSAASQRLVRPKASAGAVAAASTDSTDWDEVYTGQALPSHFAGPLEVQPVPGKGRGLVSSRDISAGELLLVSLPLVYLTAEGEEGEPPNINQMLDKLQSQRYTPHQLAWLKALYAGEAHGEPGPVPPLTTQPQQGGTAEDAGAEARAINAADLDDALRFNVLALNQTAGVSQDLVSCIARGETPAGYLGLWPEWSLLNHSCVPNAEWLTIGDRMVVRANRPVSKGSEVTISYLGPSAILRPAAERLMDLREGWDCACACPRCDAEMDDAHSTLVRAVQTLDAAVMYDVAPGVQAALGEQGAAGALGVVEASLKRLQTLVTSFEQQLAQAAGAGESTQLLDWMRASAFQAYSVQAQLQDLRLQLQAQDAPADAVNAQDATQLIACEKAALNACASVLPSADQQVIQAVKIWARLQEAAGPDSPEAQQAGAEAMQLVQWRYGKLREETVTLLLQAAAVALNQ